MKTRIFSVALAVALMAIAITGGTLAYFTDTEAKGNVFTAGNVEINLHESNNDRVLDDYDYDKNIAGENVLKDEDYQNWLEDLDPLFVPMRTVEKDVWVENCGNNPMYTRVHIGVPAAAYDRNVDPANHIIALALQADAENSGWTLYKEDGVTPNYYYEEFYGVEYFVMVLTYTEVVEKDTQTPICLSYVHMYEEVADSNWYIGVDGKQYVNYTRGDGLFAAKYGEVPVLVAAEAGQEFGFEGVSAQEALDKQFGTPSSTVEYVSPLAHLFDADGEIISAYEDN